MKDLDCCIIEEDELKLNIFNNCMNSTKQTKRQTIVDIVSLRERGKYYNLNFIDAIEESEVEYIGLNGVYQCCEKILGISNCLYVRGYKDGQGIFGLWTGPLYDNVVQSVKFKMDGNSGVDSCNTVFTGVDVLYGPYFSRGKIHDVCELYERGIEGGVSYVGETTAYGRGMMGKSIICTLPPMSPGYQGIIQVPLCCCDASPNFLALGSGQGKIYLYSREYIREVQGFDGERVSCLRFSPDGNNLYCTGKASNISIFDVRTAYRSNDIKCSPYGTELGTFIEFQMLSDERTVLVSNDKGQVLKVDMRWQGPIFTYDHSISNNKNVSFSLSEVHKLASTTTEDGLTRLWSLASGKLLKTINPFSRGKAFSFIVCNKRKWTVAIFQEDFVYSVGPKY